MTPLNVAVIGCGVIASPYAEHMRAYDSVRLHACHDVDHEKAEAYARTHGAQARASLDELLADQDVDIVVNLTVLGAHHDVSRRALRAGKHVFSEKPLAERGEDAWELVRLAREAGVRLACAPITFLGAAQRRAVRELRSGRIGTVRVIYAEANHGRIETWHPVPHSFYRVGPLRDVGVYPLSVITAAFGPAARVTAVARSLMPERVTKRGAAFRTEAPDWYVVTLDLSAGPVVRLTASFYTSQHGRQRGIEFHGDLGMLHLGDWLSPHADVHAAAFGEAYTELPTVEGAVAREFNWAAGLDDLARAVREDRPHVASGEQAAHLVDIFEAAHASIEHGGPVEVHSSFTPVSEPR